VLRLFKSPSEAEIGLDLVKEISKSDLKTAYGLANYLANKYPSQAGLKAVRGELGVQIGVVVESTQPTEKYFIDARAKV